MDRDDLLAMCTESERDGVDYVVLRVTTRREPGQRMRVLPGVLADVIETGHGYAVVRAPVAGIRRYVERMERSESDGNE